jgi:nitronate monooxygenase
MNTWRWSSAGTKRKDEKMVKTFEDLLGVDLPIIQAPMAGVQGSGLASAVSMAGGLGSLPCAMLNSDNIRQEITAIQSQASKPFNVNFFCHTPPKPDAGKEIHWRELLAPFYRELKVDPPPIGSGTGRFPFNEQAADVFWSTQTGHFVERFIFNQ